MDRLGATSRVGQTLLDRSFGLFNRLVFKKVPDNRATALHDGRDNLSFTLIAVCPDNSLLNAHICWLEACGVSVIRAGVGEVACRARLANNPIRILLIDLSVFSDLSDGVDWLMEFRKRHPEMLVMIASESFRSDDLSFERRAIADASIKLPSGRDNLLRGIEHVLQVSGPSLLQA